MIFQMVTHVHLFEVDESEEEEIILVVNYLIHGTLIFN